MIEALLFWSGAMLFSVAMTAWVRRLAMARGILDAPNARSSHTQVTPRGGGIAIASACAIGLAIACVIGAVDLALGAALMLGGLAVAWIGFEDDRRSASVRLRLLVHVGAAAAALGILGGLPPLQFGDRVIDLGLIGDILGVVAIVWVINLFNFMDGIDGIAGSEAAVLGAIGGGLALTMLGASAIGMAGAIVSGACCGFLVWNWPPARIFMGDTGSGFLGFYVAVLAVATARAAPASLLIWLILGGVFFVDATVTFLRRLLRGVRVHEAHREHAYQWLSRRWRSHRKVVWTVLAINLGWLTPCAWYAAKRPQLAVWIAACALIPLVVAAIIAGSGRRENPEG